MTKAETSPIQFCPECGASLPPQVTRCWLCGRDIAPSGPATLTGTPFAEVAGAGTSPFEQRAKFQFSIASMLLWMTLAAILLSLFTISPGLGILLGILSAPAAIRTAVLAMRREAAGRPMTVESKVTVFLGTAGIVLIFVVAALAAFVATCFPLGLAAFGANAGGLVVVAFLAGLLASGLALYGLYRLFRNRWPG